MYIKKNIDAKNIFLLRFLIILAVLFILRIFFMLNYNLLVEEAYYWNYAQHIDFSYLDHPPMVAILVKFGTLLFGANEWGVRAATFFCWAFTLFFSFKLSNLVKQGAGIFSLLLVCILPFFFIHSLIITPDIPLILSWSASLYYLYRACVREEKNCWYWAGFWIGAGLLSKYTIVLLGPATLCYLLIVPSARKWFLRKEPYFCALLALILFSPVIYWNATHQWASFLFQSTRRLQAHDSFSLHIFIGLLIVYLTPAGFWATFKLFAKPSNIQNQLDRHTKYFFQIFTAIPLLVFLIFSLFHTLKINWIGPSLLATIPWLAIMLKENEPTLGYSARRSWFITGVILFIGYSAMLLCIVTGKPEKINEYLFHKLMPWDNLTKQVHNIADDFQKRHGEKLIIVPLDLYNIGSELIFYQQKQFNDKKIKDIYKIIGSHIFQTNSLMYQYWGGLDDVSGKTLLLISKEPYRFNNEYIFRDTTPLSPLLIIHARNKLTGNNSKIFYYKIVKMREA